MRITALVPALALLALAGSFTASGQDASPDREYIIRDNGIRCVRAPCASRDAIEVTTGQVTRITGYDIGGLNLTDTARQALSDDLYDGRLVVLGRLRVQGEQRVVVISRIVRRAPGAPAPRTPLR